MALAALAKEWSSQKRVKLFAATVDHGLRKESAEEAQIVSAYCAEIGVAHETLNWSDWDGQGNLQDAARDARAILMSDWAARIGISAIATGHTADDQAETVLMRLARGSGVDGLSAIAPVSSRFGVEWHRPLLSQTRAHLRDFLANEGLPWSEDPSNDNPRFDRVKIRQAMETLEELGVTASGLVDTAQRMARARIALESITSDLLSTAAKVDRGDVILDWAAFKQASEEIRGRAVAKILMWVSGAHYKPRAAALQAFIGGINAGRTSVLNGCQVGAEGSFRRVTREFSAVNSEICPLGEIWDGRWQLAGPKMAGAEIRALGDGGVRACPDWRESGLPRTSLIASPSVWQGDRLIAAPLARFGRGWSAKLAPNYQELAKF